MTSAGERDPIGADPVGADPIAEATRLWVEHGWGDAADGMAAITSLMRAQQIALARVEAALRPFGVTFARYEVLMLLLFSRRGSLPMRIISDRLQVHQTSVTNAVDRLEAAGLVARQPHPQDRRAILVHLSDDGRALALKATEALNTSVFNRSMFARVPPTTAPHPYDPDLPASPPDPVKALVALLTDLRRAAGDF